MVEQPSREPVSLTAGVLIIGSLYWDPEPIREKWRKSRLDMATTQVVTAPIRYGRRSQKRGNTHTMVLSRSARTGHARAVGCTHPISTADDLIAEAQFLWDAEVKERTNGCIAANWGCVALLPNPQAPIPNDMLSAWAGHVQQQPNYGKVSHTEAEGRLIDENGLLQIDWPRVVGSNEPLQLNLLLVTANDPKLGNLEYYPVPEEIAKAWEAAGSKYAEYFWKNLDNGICTFEDDQIRNGMSSRASEDAAG